MPSLEVPSEESEHLPPQDTSNTTPEKDAVVAGQESLQTIAEAEQTHLSSQPEQQLELPFQYQPYSQMQDQKVRLSPNSTRKGVQLSPTRKGVRLSPNSARKGIKRTHSDATNKRHFQFSPNSRKVVKRSHSSKTDSIRVQVKVQVSVVCACARGGHSNCVVFRAATCGYSQ